MRKTKIKKQKKFTLKKLKLKKEDLINSGFASAISAPLCSFLPGLGGSQAAIIGKTVLGDLNEKQFLILLGAINTIVAALSFITLYTIGKARTGTAQAIKNLLSKLTSTHLTIIIVTIIFSSIAAFFITIYVSKLFSKYITKINYKKLSSIILIFLGIITIYFSGLLGLLIFVASSSLGITAILFKTRRTHLMGALLLPTILFYLL